MYFSVTHTTCYKYSKVVTDSFNDAHLCPVSDNFQICEEFLLETNPSVKTVLRRLDFYTNQVHHFEVLEPHRLLQVVAKSKVITNEDFRDYTVISDACTLKELLKDEQYYDFLQASERVALSSPVLFELSHLQLEKSDVRLHAEGIMRFIYTDFEYSSGSTQVDTPVNRVLETRKGVCQDFAHLMIALCRASGIPTRYVSGYFYVEKRMTETADDNSASHAWVECFLPCIGWVGYDPTHNRRVDSTYIKLAIGRDYADVRPLAGTYKGSSSAELSVDVQVVKIT
jgi:transglutaminase-like putative cysteine protease